MSLVVRSFYINIYITFSSDIFVENAVIQLFFVFDFDFNVIFEVSESSAERTGEGGVVRFK
jgi:hypothetical protein